MEDRRTTQRQKSFLKGTIFFNNRRSTVDCVIRDISAQGARLHATAMAAVPEAIELYIPNKDQTFRAQVKWRKGDEIGVFFPSADAAADDSSPQSGSLAQRVERLEAEMAKVHRLVVELRLEIRKLRGE